MQLSDEQLTQLGDVVAAIGQPAFPERLAQFLRGIAPYSYTVIFGYHGAAAPVDLFDDFPEGKRRVFVGDYQEGPYLLDPFYLAATRPVAAGIYRMKDLAPDRFYQGEYFRSYYVRTGLAEEIGYFTAIGGGAMVVLSLMRADRPFLPREMRLLAALCPIVQAAVRQHWPNLEGRLDTASHPPGEAPSPGIARAFADFGAGLLTARERQIVEHTLKGHSAEAVGRLLGISPGTVRIHRRNIYQKLRINSQGELFSLFIAEASSP